MRWDTALDLVAHELSHRSWVAVEATLGHDLDSERLRRLFDLAGDNERHRLEASAGAGPALRSVVAGLLLRKLLGHITGVDASTLRFETGPHGKPFLAGEGSAPHFNVSHCASHGLIALSDRFEIGVDVETIADYKEGVARRILPPEDFAKLDRLDPSERARLFYLLWVAKEACVKATGAGFSTSLDDVGVAVGATEGRWGAVRWQILDIADNACACVALASGDTEIEQGCIYYVDAIEALNL